MSELSKKILNVQTELKAPKINTTHLENINQIG